MEKSGVILSVFLLLVVIGVVATSPPSGYQIGGSNFFKDRSAPQLSVSQAPLNPTVGQTITFTAKASDSTKVRLIQIYVDSSLKKNCFPNSAIGSCVFTTDKLSAGTHTYYAAALDTRGNRAREPAKTATKSFEVSQPTTTTSSGSGKGAGGAQTTGGGTTITVSPEPVKDPYGHIRYYIDPSKGDKLKLNIKCDVDSGTPVIKVGVREKSYSGRYVGGSGYSDKSPYDYAWDGTLDNYGTYATRGVYTLEVRCDKDKDDRAEAIYEKDIFIDDKQPKFSSYIIDPHYKSELVREFQAELPGVTRIDFAGVPGGWACGAKIKMNAYDKDGKEVASSLSYRPEKCTWSNCDKSGFVDAGEIAFGSTGTITGSKNVKKVVGTTEGFSWNNKCGNIDEFYVVLAYTPPSGGSGGGTQTYDFYVGASGSGKITSSDGKISCGIDCYEKYGTGSKVTLTATADSGSTFSSWSGCTSSTNTCTVTVDSEKKITAAFVTKPPTSDSVQLAVSKSGTGSGRIYSVPAGIDCGLKCTANFAKGASVRLNAVPDGGNTLTSWGGACSSAGTSLSCTLTTDGAKSVSASFAGPVGDKTPPTVSASHDILNPQPTQAVTIVATAFDDSGKTPSLALFVDSSAVAARCYIIENTRICEYKKTYASGTHNYYATATDSSGNIGRYPSAGARSFTVGSGVTDKTAPTVSAYTTPASPKVGETVVYTTSASDDVLLKEIQIYVDGHLVQKCTPVNTKTGAICEFRISYLSPGAHTFMAKAEDTSGNVRWDPSSSTTKSVSVTAVAGAGEGVEVALPFPINAWGYYNRYGDCSSQEVNRAWADAFCKAKGYAGTISGDACYQEPVGGRYSVAGTPQSPKQGDYKGQGLAFTKVRCTYATAVPAGTGTS